MQRFGIMFAIFLLVACSTAPPPEPTPDIDALVAATVSAERLALYQPELISPADAATFDNPVDVILTWQWARSLRENEYFDVQVWKAGEPEYGITWSQDTEFDLSTWLSFQTPGEFFWSVAAITGQDGEVQSVLGEAPPARRFTLQDNIIPSPTPTPTPSPLRVENMVIVPQDFKANIFAMLTEAPTAITTIAFTPEGDMLALALDGRLWRLSDDDGDGTADRTEQILFNDDPDSIRLVYAAGMALHEGRVYVSESTRVGYLTDEDGDGIYDDIAVVVDGLLGLQYPFHSNNGIAFDPDGKLYISIGSTSDHGPLVEELEASILRANADGTDLEVFATGFRNAFDIAFSPDGRLFAGDNAPDRIDSIMPFYPPEELNYVREGHDYGFPNVYGFGKSIGPHDREWTPPIVELITSSVSAGIVYYAADLFPEAYNDGVFLAQYGGFTKAGRQVIFVELVPTDDGGYSGIIKPFVNFFGDLKPVEVTVGPDGALYVVEWLTGYILRVTYEGD